MASVRSCLVAFVFVTMVAMLTTVEGQVTEPDFDCPEDGQFAHPDCWKWYNCGEGTAYVMECPEDWLYDPVNIWCEFPENVECGDRNPRP